MYRVPLGARNGLRFAVLTITAAAFLVATIDSADAARKRKRGIHKRAVQSEIHSPKHATIVVDAKTGSTLQQSNADGLCHPASLTKIMTLYLLFEQIEAGKIKLHTRMPVSEAAAAQAPTKLGLKPGQTLAVEDAIKALVTKSANDAAVVVAEALAGSEEEFARQMTRKARALGMKGTVYRNASGLPDLAQVTTAREQALLGIAIQERFPRYYRYFSTPSFSYAGRAMRNHNKLLGRVAGIDGIKTGYTRASGFNLVTSMRRDDRHIVAVVLGGSSGGQRDARMRALVEGHIMAASAKRTAPIQVAELQTTRPDTVAAKPRPATVSVPVPQSGHAMTSTPHTGSTEPIKPVPVKTLVVKLAQPKPAPVQTAAVAPMVAAKPAPSAPAPQLVEASALPAAAPADRPGFLGAAVAAAGNAIVPSAKAAEAPRAVPRSGWAIQIGAFEAESEAKHRLSAAQTKAATLLKKADPYTEKTNKGEKTYYRARFAGFDRDEAQAACKQLKRSDIVCMALKI